MRGANVADRTLSDRYALHDTAEMLQEIVSPETRVGWVGMGIE